MNNIKANISIKSLMKVINSIYQEKILLCKDNQNNKKSEVSMVLYDYMTNKYGLKAVAEGKFRQIIMATCVYKEKYLRVKNFAKFLYIEGNYSVEE